jgi:predicted metal-dependent hydrolase
MSSSLPIRYRHSSRAKRLSLRITGFPAFAEVVVPQGMSLKKAEKWAHTMESWIKARLDTSLSLTPITTQSTELVILGTTYRLLHHTGTRSQVKAEESLLHVYAREGLHGIALKRYICQVFLAWVTTEVQTLCAQFNLPMPQLNLRELFSRWGSCTPSLCRITLSWRLALAPKEVAFYVVAHEMAHLKHPNHSKAFWHYVATLFPGYTPYKRWLALHGKSLHSLQF